MRTRNAVQTRTQFPYGFAGTHKISLGNVSFRETKSLLQNGTVSMIIATVVPEK